MFRNKLKGDSNCMPCSGKTKQYITLQTVRMHVTIIIQYCDNSEQSNNCIYPLFGLATTTEHMYITGSGCAAINCCKQALLKAKLPGLSFLPLSFGKADELRAARSLGMKLQCMHAIGETGTS